MIFENKNELDAAQYAEDNKASFVVEDREVFMLQSRLQQSLMLDDNDEFKGHEEGVYGRWTFEQNEAWWKHIQRYGNFFEIHKRKH